MIEVLDPPVGYAKWKQNSIYINDKLVKNNLNNKTLDILLPNDSDSGQEWWKWFTNGSNNMQWLEIIIDLTSSAIGALVTSVLNCSTPGVGFGIGFTTGMIINEYIKGFVKKIDFDYKKNKIICDNYYDLILSNGYSVNFSPIDLNLNNNENKIKINSIVKYGAKATAIFGDGTQAKIFSNPGIASIECSLRKYVEK